MNKPQILELANEYLSANYSHFTQEQKDLAIALCLLAFKIGKGVCIGDAKAGSGKSAVIKAFLFVTLHISNEIGVEFPKILVTMFNKKPQLDFVQSLTASGFPVKLAESIVKTSSSLSLGAMIQAYPAQNVRGADGKFKHPLFAKVGATPQQQRSAIERIISVRPISIETMYTEELIEAMTSYFGKTISTKQQARDARRTMDNFVTSIDFEMNESHVDCKFFEVISTFPCAKEINAFINSYKQTVLNNAKKIWKEFSSTNMYYPASTFPVVLKMWQLHVANGGEVFSNIDLLVDDEAQDTSNVLLDIIVRAASRGLNTAGIGDPFQSIYGFIKAEDALEHLKGIAANDPSISIEVKPLSQSFRFGQQVANVANAILGLIPEYGNQRIRGSDSIVSIIHSPGKPEGKYVELCRTNAGAFSGIVETLAAGKMPFIFSPKGIVEAKKMMEEEVLNYMLALCDVYDEVASSIQHDAVQYRNWGEIVNVLSMVDDPALSRAKNLIESKGSATIRQLCLDLKAKLMSITSYDQIDVQFGTAHSTKGLQFPTVVIGEDFFPLGKNSKGEDVPVSKQECHVWYVAATRAVNNLYLSKVFYQALVEKYGDSVLDKLNSVDIFEYKIETVQVSEDNETVQVSEDNETVQVSEDIELPTKIEGIFMDEVHTAFPVLAAVVFDDDEEIVITQKPQAPVVIVGEDKDKPQKDFLAKHSGFFKSLTDLAHSTASLYKGKYNEIDVRLEGIAPDYSPFSGTADEADAAIRLFNSYKIKYGELKEHFVTVSADYSAYCGTRRSGVAHSFKMQAKGQIDLLKEIYGGRSRAVRKKKVVMQDFVLDKSLFVATAEHRITRTVRQVPLQVLLRMFQNGIDYSFDEDDAFNGQFCGNYEITPSEFIPDDGCALFIPESLQRPYHYSKKSEKPKEGTPEYVAASRAVDMIGNILSKRFSPGLMLLTERKKGTGAFGIDEGQQRTVSLFHFVNNRIGYGTTNVHGKPHHIFFKNLPIEDQEYILNFKFTVELVTFEEDVDELTVDSICSQQFVAFNSSGLKLTTDEINNARPYRAARELFKSYAKIPEMARAISGLDRVELASFFPRVLVMTFSRINLGNDLSAKIAEVVNPLPYDTLVEYMSIIKELVLIGESINAFRYNSTFSISFAETFLASFLEMIVKGRLTIEDVREKTSSLMLMLTGTNGQQRTSGLYSDSTYIAVTMKGVNNQKNITHDKTREWTGRYPKFFKRIIEPLFGVPFSEFFNSSLFVDSSED